MVAYHLASGAMYCVATTGGSQSAASRCRAGELARLGVTPLLCGAAQTPYAEAQRERLRAAVPDAVIERRFLGPAELAQVRAVKAWRASVFSALLGGYHWYLVHECERCKMCHLG